MSSILRKLKQPSTYAGLAGAAAGLNIQAVNEMGTPQWWTALLGVAFGVVAAARDDSK